MQDEHTYTKEQLHQAFHNYHEEKFGGVESEENTYLETAERIIPNTLNDYFGTAFTSIYEIQNAGEVENFQQKMFPQQYQRFMSLCISHWSRNPYFERRRGARPLPPDEQDFILDAAKRAGVTTSLEFDSYEDVINWYD